MAEKFGGEFLYQDLDSAESLTAEDQLKVVGGRGGGSRRKGEGFTLSDGPTNGKGPKKIPDKGKDKVKSPCQGQKCGGYVQGTSILSALSGNDTFEQAQENISQDAANFAGSRGVHGGN